MEKSKFDDWSAIKDCNKCEPYWNNQCDGATVGTEMPCNAFVAVRRVSIPAEIKAIRKHLKWLYAGLVVEAVLLILLFWV